ncbi:MAG TPA: cupin domain-containing protein [Bryobacteraceae bacterium]|nr:cupin domain-containing protein [Bryobacteraceae bacterium]
MKKTVLILGFAFFATTLCAQQKAPMLWAPKPVTLPHYVPPEKPHTRLAELLERHKDSADWRAVIVDDDHLNAVYISSPAGMKTEPSMHPDTREWWVVMGGQIRFNIEGQEPFVASKGWLVQVPYRTVFSLETIGDKPSLRFEVNIAHAKTLYPRDEKPPEMPGFNWELVRLPQPRGVYDRGNKPYIIFDDIAANFEKKPKKDGQYRFINDDRAVSNIIYGYEKDLPPANPADRGHYHAECAEFWIILAGQIRYKIEGQAPFVADTGDVVYVPKFTYHMPRFYGPGPSCRLAMNGYPEIGHLFDGHPMETSQR